MRTTLDELLISLDLGEYVSVVFLPNQVEKHVAPVLDELLSHFLHPAHLSIYLRHGYSVETAEQHFLAECQRSCSIDALSQMNLFARELVMSQVKDKVLADEYEYAESLYAKEIFDLESQSWKIILSTVGDLIDHACRVFTTTLPLHSSNKIVHA